MMLAVCSKTSHKADIHAPIFCVFGLWCQKSIAINRPKQQTKNCPTLLKKVCLIMFLKTKLNTLVDGNNHPIVSIICIIKHCFWSSTDNTSSQWACEQTSYFVHHCIFSNKCKFIPKLQQWCCKKFCSGVILMENLPKQWLPAEPSNKQLLKQNLNSHVYLWVFNHVLQTIKFEQRFGSHVRWCFF